MSEIRIELYFDPINGPLQNWNFFNFTAHQNSVSEYSFEGVPASLYNLTESVPDPLKINNMKLKPKIVCTCQCFCNSPLIKIY